MSHIRMRHLAKTAALLSTFLLACVPRESGDFDGPHARDLVAAGAPLIDVRTESEYAEGHIKGAVNIPVQDINGRLAEVATLVEGDKSRPIVVHCRSGKRSAAAREILRHDGFSAVTNMGGIDVWEQ